MRDPNKNTTFTFFCFEHESVNLKIRLRYDGLKQSEFFRSLLLKYINQDPTMMSLVHDIKLEQKVMGKKKLKKTKEDYERSKELLESLGITESDRENIYDIIEGSIIDEE